MQPDGHLGGPAALIRALRRTEGALADQLRCARRVEDADFRAIGALRSAAPAAIPRPERSLPPSLPMLTCAALVTLRSSAAPCESATAYLDGDGGTDTMADVRRLRSMAEEYSRRRRRLDVGGTAGAVEGTHRAQVSSSAADSLPL